MPESEKQSLIDTLIRAIIQRGFGGLGRYAERLVKRLLRMAGLYAVGLVVALVGIVFVSMGVVKWLAMMMASWLAWLIVGLILLLLGMVLTLATLVASKD
jgi:hypothetical protein